MNYCICKQNYKVETRKININENLWEREEAGEAGKHKKDLNWHARFVEPDGEDMEMQSHPGLS